MKDISECTDEWDWVECGGSLYEDGGECFAEFGSDSFPASNLDLARAKVAASAPMLFKMLEQALLWEATIADSLIAQHEGELRLAVSLKMKALTQMQAAQELLDALRKETS